jgi:predicted phosphoadenosine phosphosulfate sulfurtransferase
LKKHCLLVDRWRFTKMKIKKYQQFSVLTATRERIRKVFDDFEKIYISFSGGKDSSVMTHLVLEEAIKRNRKVCLLIIDLEAQYQDTIKHIELMVEQYKDHIDLHWVCVPLLLRNAVSNYQPRWICWDEENKPLWVREKPIDHKDGTEYDFFVPKMEFEEFMVLFGEWYSDYGKYKTAAFIGIRADESLHRYRAIASRKDGIMYNNFRWTTKIAKNLYNIYPIYDWRTEDIWIYHGKFPDKIHNAVYDKMNMAGVKLSQQRLCQPYGDDQRKGLWLYHILEPETWYKLINRVNGVNSGALYIQENGNMTGYYKITKPDGHTWQSFCNLLLQTMPKKTREHYTLRFKKFISSWQDRGYKSIPEEAPDELEAKQWAPSWRRLCKVLLRNDYWCKSLGQTQPFSEAYGKFKDIKELRKRKEHFEKTGQLEIFKKDELNILEQEPQFRLF